MLSCFPGGSATDRHFALSLGVCSDEKRAAVKEAQPDLKAAEVNKVRGCAWPTCKRVPGPSVASLRFASRQSLTPTSSPCPALQVLSGQWKELDSAQKKV